MLSCKLTVAPLIDSPSSKVNVPPVEEIVVPLLKLTVPTTVRSAVCVARVPGGEPESLPLSEEAELVPLSLESPRLIVKSVVSEPSVRV